MRTSRFKPHRITALAITLAPLLAWAAPGLFAAIDEVKSPHGKLKEPCATCHTAKGWKQIRVSPKFDHAKFGFPLHGAHKTDCMSCHTSLEFKAADIRCASCHQDPHRGEMGIDCARCHGPRSFIDRAPMVRGHQLTRFPLTGAHATLECEICHVVQAQGHLQFKGTRAACEDCHRDDYMAARAPDHGAGGFPLQCAQCHGTIAWEGVRFGHEKTAFPLTGAHRRVSCERCHGDGVYDGKPTDCVSCHRADYDATSDPNHVAIGFSTQCQTCHSTTAWHPGRFDHDSRNFPIYSGRHATLWSGCSDCHNNPSTYSQFTCFSCHPHSSRTQTDSNHGGVSGYLYDSNACYSCHPRGQS